MMERFPDVRAALEKTVLSDTFLEWAAKQPNTKSKDDSLSKREKIKKAVKIIEDNELAESMQEVVDLIVPVVKVLHMCDIYQARAGFLYQAMADRTEMCNISRHVMCVFG